MSRTSDTGSTLAVIAAEQLIKEGTEVQGNSVRFLFSHSKDKWCMNGELEQLAN
jgi:hypothetical protein